MPDMLNKVGYILCEETMANVEFKIKDENSIFNQHLDEILYFFQCTKYNTVIIEDLDRFDTPDIFLKLRELNFLLNQSNIIERKIKFVYAIKDDMFKDASGSVIVDIDDEDWRGMTVTPQDTVIINGEVDKDFFKTKIDVDSISIKK